MTILCICSISEKAKINIKKGNYTPCAVVGESCNRCRRKIISAVNQAIRHKALQAYAWRKR